MTIQGVKRAAIYARISKAEPDVDKVENQINELRQLALKNSYEVVEIFEDDDTSAYKGTSTRSGYLNLINGLNEKRFDVVLATEPQRLTRGSQSELEALAIKCVQARAIIHTRSAGVQDPATPTTLALMQIMDVIGGLEVATKIERQKARNRADLSAGMPTKGLRPFGWEPDRVTVREHEAAFIRQAVRDILDSGKTTWGVAQDWNALGVRTDGMSRPRKSVADGTKKIPPATWTTSTVRQLLLRARNAGILMHEGAEWPNSKIQPIISRAEFEAVKDAIRGVKTSSGPKPQYLLGGILECPCGARMHASKSNTKRAGKAPRGYKIYRCRLYGFDKSQSHVAIHLDIADRVVRDWVVTDIGLASEDEKIKVSAELSPIMSALTDLAKQESQTTKLFIKGLGDEKELEGTLASIKSQRELLEHRRLDILSNAAHSVALANFREKMQDLPDAAADDAINQVLEDGFKAWDELPMSDKRDIIRGKYRIKVNLGGRGEDRVEITSRDASS